MKERRRRRRRKAKFGVFGRQKSGAQQNYVYLFLASGILWSKAQMFGVIAILAKDQLS